MLTSELDYFLPPERIAQEPLAERGASRMMVLHRDSGAWEHREVADLPACLRPGDLLILNDTRVFPARILGVWSDTGGAVELLLLEPSGDTRTPRTDAHAETWICLCGSGRRVRPGLTATLAGGGIAAEFLGVLGEGRVEARLVSSEPLADVLDRRGLVPVPPYIHRDANDARAGLDRERYQTVFARERGAVAAPTAGLHFTAGMLESLRKQGVEHAFLTLHIGPGTFKPVQTEILEEHRMDPERYEVPAPTAAAVNACRSRGGRIVAVGSTSVRTLETVAAAHDGAIVACAGRTALFIRPPCAFRAVDAMLTNFHLPRSTLLAMVAAFAGQDLILRAYHEAVVQRYRFFSYGDCMLIV